MTTAVTTGRRRGQLPRGRHNLTREFVIASQRERMHEAVLNTIATLGYCFVTVGDITDGAGISRKTFYEHYPSGIDACYSDAFLVEMYRALDAKTGRLEHFLEHFDGRRHAARACIVEGGATSVLREMRRSWLTQLFRFSSPRRKDAVSGALVAMVEGALDRDEPLTHLLQPLLTIAEASR